MIGTAIAGAFFAEGLLFSITAAAINGALIGAAIGGISAAVTGGNIAQGMLFGAIGGAVTGGIMGYLNPAGFLATGTFGAETMVTTAGETVIYTTEGATMETINVLSAEVTKDLGGSLLSGGVGEIVGETGSQLLGEGITEGIKGYLGNEAAKEAADRASEEAALQHERNKELLQMRLAGSGGGGGGGAQPSYDHVYAQIAENARQFDLARGDRLEAEKKMRSTFGAESRRGSLEGPTLEADELDGGESIQEKLNNKRRKGALEKEIAVEGPEEVRV